VEEVVLCTVLVVLVDDDAVVLPGVWLTLCTPPALDPADEVVLEVVLRCVVVAAPLWTAPAAPLLCTVVLEEAVLCTVGVPEWKLFAVCRPRAVVVVVV
jgi:hypothetical protein